MFCRLNKMNNLPEYSKHVMGTRNGVSECIYK